MVDQENEPKAKKGAPKNTGEWIALGAGMGVALGAGIGVSISNLPVGIAVGVALGPAMGMIIARMQQKKGR